MANEGEFPKSDGDILYASEVNNFASAGHFIEVGSFATIGSATAEQDIGSIVIPANTLTNFSNIRIITTSTTGGDHGFDKVQISGTSANVEVQLGNDSAWAANVQYTILATIGSPLNGGLSMETPNVNAGFITGAADLLSNLDVGSVIVIRFFSQVDKNYTIDSYFVQSFGNKGVI